MFLGRNVLITGGAGFIGSALARALLAAGDHVLVTCRREAQPIAIKAAKDYTADIGANNSPSARR